MTNLPPTPTNQPLYTAPSQSVKPPWPPIRNPSPSNPPVQQVQTISGGGLPKIPKTKISKALLADLFALLIGIVALSGFGYVVFTRVSANTAQKNNSVSILSFNLPNFGSIGSTLQGAVKNFWPFSNKKDSTTAPVVIKTEEANKKTADSANGDGNKSAGSFASTDTGAKSATTATTSGKPLLKPTTQSFPDTFILPTAPASVDTSKFVTNNSAIRQTVSSPIEVKYSKSNLTPFIVSTGGVGGISSPYLLKLRNYNKAPDTTDMFTVSKDGNVVAAGDLKVKGKLNVDDNFYTALDKGSVSFIGSSGKLTQDNANFYWDDTNNRLGIGTTSPSTKLDVSGTLNATGATTLGSTLNVTSATTLNSTLNVVSNATFDTNTLFVNASTDRVGIGTTAPGYVLDVVGTLNASGAVTFGSTLVNTGLATFNGGVTVGVGQTVTINSDAFTDLTGTNLTVASGALGTVANPVFSTSVSTPTLTTASGNLTIDPTGNLIVVGSGATSATGALEVRNSSGTPILYTRNDGNVGIGTTAPAKTLDVNGTIQLAGNLTQANTTVVSGTLIAAPGTGTCASQANTTTQAILQTSTAVTSSHIFYNSTRTRHSRITSVATCTDGSSLVYQIMTLTDAIASNAATDSAIVYNPVGNLGDTTSGFVNNAYAINYLGLTSTLTGGFDLAEQYRTDDESIEAGDVVSIDKNSTEKINKSSKEYDNKVIGIITTSPGISLGGEQGGVWKKVALVGRVPVKVTTLNGEIKVGDALTTSPVAGVAMKASKEGAIIGKAMEGYKNSDETKVGKIVAFVNTSWNSPKLYEKTAADTQDRLDLINSQLAGLTDAVNQSSPAATITLLGQMQQLYDNFTAVVSTLGMSTQGGKLAVNSDMNVLGDVTAKDLTLTGDISAGLVKINSTGLVKAVVFATKSVATNENAGRATSGKITIKAGVKTAEIKFDSGVLSDTSLMFVTAEQPVAVGAKRTGDNTFEISIKDVLDADLSVSWWVVN